MYEEARPKEAYYYCPECYHILIEDEEERIFGVGWKPLPFPSLSMLSHSWDGPQGIRGVFDGGVGLKWRGMVSGGLLC